MNSTVEVLPAQATVREALERTGSRAFRAWPVTDQRGVIGVVSLVTLEHELADGAAVKRLGELVDARHFPHVHKDQTLDLALERMGAAQIELLPVVSHADIHKLEGVITLRDVLDSFGVTTQLDTAHRSIPVSTSCLR
ncbi:MAG: CBS domain-containing protein [Candidatus Sulfotelmatobacter sp.]